MRAVSGVVQICVLTCQALSCGAMSIQLGRGETEARIVESVRRLKNQ